jgi:flagellar protein FlgJ
MKNILIALVLFLMLKNFYFDKPSKNMYKYDKNLSSSEKIKNWFNWIVPIIKPIAKKYGIPYEALAVQTGWETGWGKSSLIYDAYNFAGMKAVKGEPFVTRRTHEYRNGVKVYEDAKFRKFNSLEEGLEGYANFFHKYKRYAKALETKDPYEFISRIHKAGYATSPNYTKNLHGVLDKNLQLIHTL